MEGGNNRLLIIIVVIVAAIVAVIAFGWGKGGTESTVSTSAVPGSTLPAAVSGGGKAPADLLPAAIAGFDSGAKDLTYKSGFPGEQSAAAISFKPSVGSKFENKVESLTIYISQFDSSKNATTLVTTISSSYATVDRDVNGAKLKLYYQTGSGAYILYIQKDKLVGYAYAKPSAKATLLDMATIQDAVILGYSMIKF